MKKTPFDIAREDGRSDAQVIYDLAVDKQPDTLHTYDDLHAALQNGLDRKVTRQRVYAAVSAGNKLLLSQAKRYLRVVRGQGYRLIQSSEHLETALAKKDRAQVYISKGRDILEHTDMSDLTPAQRKIHEGQLFILSGLLTHMKESNRRHAEQEQVLEDLKQRVSKLESN
jgi:hypothetical protein